MKKIILLSRIFLLSACSLGVVSLGDGTYNIIEDNEDSTAWTITSAIPLIKKEAITKANKFCAKKNKNMIKVSHNLNANSHDAIYDLTFKCE